MSNKRNAIKDSSARNVALCYIRRSWVKTEKDLVSPEIQRQSIQRVCEAHGWTMEWYEDAEGHKSGMHEQNRPGWLSLKARMSDSDVTAIVAYDLSRLHRRGWRIGDLLDFVDRHNIRLVLADPNRSVDFSTPQGRLMAQLAALFDEYYAVDISIRRKANIAYKKSLNKTVGIPPFGTKRNKEGYLMPSPEGAWLLPTGLWQSGLKDQEPPEEGAVWRGYYDCASRILELYVLNQGRAMICKIMHEEGWAFRSRYGLPKPLDINDIVRVTKAWIEYGGIVLGKRAKDRPAYDLNPKEIALDPDRAVFDIGLLRRVGEISKERSFKQPDRGRKVSSRIYALSGLLYCAQCDTLAVQMNNPNLRTRLIGKNKTDTGKGSYRHRPGLECGCKRKMVYSQEIEGDFLRLCHLLTVDERALEAMQILAVEIGSLNTKQINDIQEKKTVTIAKAKRKLDAARHLFEDGDIDRAEYLSRKQKLERELAYWQTYTTEVETINLQLTICVEAISKIPSLWEGGDDQDRHDLAHNLFEELIYDTDRQRIVDFRLKAWAEQFLILRGQLYEDGNARSSCAPSRNRICASAFGGQRSIR